MSCIHYKFKSSLEYDTLTFDGLHIRLGDLKKLITQQKKLGKSIDFDLQITNAQTKQVYSSDDDLIPKNTSIIVSRIPVGGNSKAEGTAVELPTIAVDGAQAAAMAAGLSFEQLSQTSDLVSANASEDDKIKAMMAQSTKDYDQSNYVKSKYPMGKPHKEYVCFKCGQPGHFIGNCPHRGPEVDVVKVKRSTGIPQSFMKVVDDPKLRGVMMTSNGRFAVPWIDADAYKTGKKEAPPFVTKKVEAAPSEENPIPGELLCLICKDLLKDAVVIQCCGNSYCDECIRENLLETEDHVCPKCGEAGVSPDGLIPNTFLRKLVVNFQNETGYIKPRRLSSGSGSAAHTAQRGYPPQGQPQPRPAATWPQPTLATQPGYGHHSHQIPSGHAPVSQQSVPHHLQPQPASQPQSSQVIPSHLIGLPPHVIKAEMRALEGNRSTPSQVHHAQPQPHPGYPQQHPPHPGYAQQPRPDQAARPAYSQQPYPQQAHPGYQQSPHHPQQQAVRYTHPPSSQYPAHQTLPQAGVPPTQYQYPAGSAQPGHHHQQAHPSSQAAPPVSGYPPGYTQGPASHPSHHPASSAAPHPSLTVAVSATPPTSSAVMTPSTPTVDEPRMYPVASSASSQLAPPSGANVPPSQAQSAVRISHPPGSAQPHPAPGQHPPAANGQPHPAQAHPAQAPPAGQLHPATAPVQAQTAGPDQAKHAAPSQHHQSTHPLSAAAQGQPAPVQPPVAPSHGQPQPAPSHAHPTPAQPQPTPSHAHPTAPGQPQAPAPGQPLAAPNQPHPSASAAAQPPPAPGQPLPPGSGQTHSAVAPGQPQPGPVPRPACPGNVPGMPYPAVQTPQQAVRPSYPSQPHPGQMQPQQMPPGYGQPGQPPWPPNQPRTGYPQQGAPGPHGYTAPPGVRPGMPPVHGQQPPGGLVPSHPGIRPNGQHPPMNQGPPAARFRAPQLSVMPPNAGPPGIMPGQMMPPNMGGPRSFPGPAVPPGPGRLLTKDEFYREKERLIREKREEEERVRRERELEKEHMIKMRAEQERLRIEQEKKKQRDLESFAQDLIDGKDRPKKKPVKKSRSRTRSSSRPRSRPRSRTKSRTRSRSRPRSPYKKLSRSRTRSRSRPRSLKRGSRSRSRSRPPRPRTRSRSLSRSPPRWRGSRSPPRWRGSRSPPPRRLGSRSPRRWKGSRSPVPRRKGSRSPVPRRRGSFTRSRSWSRTPPPRMPHGRSPGRGRSRSRSPLRYKREKTPDRGDRYGYRRSRSLSRGREWSPGYSRGRTPPPPRYDDRCRPSYNSPSKYEDSYRGLEHNIMDPRWVDYSRRYYEWVQRYGDQYNNSAMPQREDMMPAAKYRRPFSRSPPPVQPKRGKYETRSPMKMRHSHSRSPPRIDDRKPKNIEDQFREGRLDDREYKGKRKQKESKDRKGKDRESDKEKKVRKSKKTKKVSPHDVAEKENRSKETDEEKQGRSDRDESLRREQERGMAKVRHEQKSNNDGTIVPEAGSGSSHKKATSGKDQCPPREQIQTLSVARDHVYMEDTKYKRKREVIEINTDSYHDATPPTVEDAASENNADQVSQQSPDREESPAPSKKPKLEPNLKLKIKSKKARPGEDSPRERKDSPNVSEKTNQSDNQHEERRRMDTNEYVSSSLEKSHKVPKESATLSHKTSKHKDKSAKVKSKAKVERVMEEVKSVKKEKPEEPGILVEPPEPSRWEKEDSGQDSDTKDVFKRLASSISKPKETLPKHVLESAEKAIIQKPRGVVSIASSVSSSRSSSSNTRKVIVDQDREKSPEKRHTDPSNKGRRVTSDERSMQVTISSSKRHSTKEESSRDGRSDKDGASSRDKRSHKENRESGLSSSRSKTSREPEARSKTSREPEARSKTSREPEARSKVSSSDKSRDQDRSRDRDRSRDQDRSRDRDRNKDRDRSSHEPSRVETSSSASSKQKEKEPVETDKPTQKIKLKRDSIKESKDSKDMPPPKANKSDASQLKSLARKLSVMDESKFEPDYEEDNPEDEPPPPPKSMTNKSESDVANSPHRKPDTKGAKEQTSRSRSSSPVSSDRDRKKHKKHKKHKHKLKHKKQKKHKESDKEKERE